MGKLKVLQVDNWMIEHATNPDEACNLILREIKPIIGRNGYYYQAHAEHWDCWFEFEGKAYAMKECTRFLHNLKSFDYELLTDKRLQLFKDLFREPDEHVKKYAKRKIDEHLIVMKRKKSEIKMLQALNKVSKLDYF